MAQSRKRSRALSSSSVYGRTQKRSAVEAPPEPPTTISLLAKRVSELNNPVVPELTASEKLLLEERHMIEHLADATKTLKPVREIAKGVEYSEPLYTGWKPPLSIRTSSEAHRRSVCSRYGIAVNGDVGSIGVPPPVTKFMDMRLPEPIMEVLKAKGIVKPTPIQMQGLPVALSGKDLIGISFTGSGKTLVFVIPLILAALQEELALPIVPGEGPSGLVLCLSRELAKQIHDVVEQFLLPLRDQGYPELRSLLCVGSVNLRSQLNAMKKGVHIVVATPGRLKHMLSTKAMKLDNCRYLTLDEADRLVDFGFEDDIREILDQFNAQRQTLLFSPTMPTKIQNLAMSSLVKPVTVNVGMAG